MNPFNKMTNMKKLFILIFILSVSSCDSFLEEKPYDFLGTNFYKNENDAAIGLNGVFGIMQSQNYYQRTVWLVSELPGDYLQTSVANAPRQELETYTYTGANSEITNWWVNAYTMISRANDLLEKVPAISMDETKKNVILGNARFLRGLAYFDLVRSFGAVPLVLATIKSPSDDMTPARNSVAEVYAQIIDDLKFAEANCLAEKDIPASEKGRASTGAAASLLAKVYLTRASLPEAEQGDVQAALDACNRVINSGLYQLLPVYSDVFEIAKENGPEHIFSVQYDLPPHIGNITVQMQYPNEAALIGGGGAGSFKVNPLFVNSYDAADTRKDWNVSNMAGAKTLANYFFYKYRDPLRQGNNSRVNWPVLRYSDVLLMQSEALNILNPGDASKFDGINAVRSRAGVSLLDFTTTPASADFVTALVNERAWELCLEGHRRYDLIRLGRLKKVQKDVYNRDLDDKYLLFPIPDTEIALNPNLNPNNPGF
jgi:starch-binding outer membrane protein, SusD/RagB family